MNQRQKKRLRTQGNRIAKAFDKIEALRLEVAESEDIDDYETILDEITANLDLALSAIDDIAPPTR